MISSLSFSTQRGVAMYWAAVIVAAAVIAASPAPQTRVAALGVLGAVGVGALLIRGVRAATTDAPAWLWIALGLACLVVGAMASLALQGSRASVDGLPMALTLLAYGPLVLGLLGLRARGGSPRVRALAADGTAIDTAIVAITSVLLAWALVLEPRFDIDAQPFHLGQLLIPALDVGVLVLLGRLVLEGGVSVRGVAFFAVGMVLLLASDATTLASTLDHTYRPGGLVDLGWPLAYASLGATAFARPCTQGCRIAWLERHGVTIRLGLVGLALLAPPMLVLLRLLRDIPRDDLLPVALASLALTLLVMLRAHLLTRTLIVSERRFRAFLEHPGLMAFIKDAGGRYSYVSPVVAEVNGWSGPDAVLGRRDTELFDPATAAAYEAVDATVRRTGTTASLEDARHRPERVWELRKFPLPGEPGAVALLGIDVTERAAAQAEVERQRSVLAEAELVTDLGSWTFDAATGLSTWSPGMRRLAGLPADETPLTPEDVYRRVHPDDLSTVQQRIRTTLRTCAPLDMEFRLAGSDGTSRTVHLVGRADPAPDGSAARVVGAVRDVTAERATTRRLAFQADLLAAVSDVVIATDAAERITYWNAAAEDLFGQPREAMLGRRLREVVAAEPAEVARLHEALAAGAAFEGDWEVRRSDGQPAWLRARVVPLPDAAEGTWGSLLVGQDITARRSLEQRLARLAGAIDQTHEAVLTLDRNERITYVNATFERLTGYSAEEVLGHRPGLLATQRMSRGQARAMRAALAAGRVWQGDFADRCKDGRIRITENTVTPLRERDLSVGGYVMIKRDVTERRAAEATEARRARERALIAEALRDLVSEPNPDLAAEAIALQVLKLPGIAHVALAQVAFAGQVVPLCSVSPEATYPRAGLPSGRSAYLRERITQGPWVETWVAPTADHPYGETFHLLGIRAFAYLPLTLGEDTQGLLAVGSAAPDAIAQLTEQLPALQDFAAIAGALLGPRLAGQAGIDRRRAAVRAIIDAAAFMPTFQPICTLTDRRTIGYEALTRFADMRRPDLQFAEARAVGLGIDLELATLARALGAATALPRGMVLHVNASAALLLEGARLSALLNGREARDLVVEVTEEDRVDDYAALRRAIARIGPSVRLGVDDAGAGYASLRHILELAPAVVKLDLSLVRGIDVDPARQALVAGLCRFAKEAGIELVAEGIETEDELAALRRLGVPLGQGYLLGRPEPPPEAPSP